MAIVLGHAMHRALAVHDVLECRRHAQCSGFAAKAQPRRFAMRRSRDNRSMNPSHLVFSGAIGALVLVPHSFGQLPQPVDLTPAQITPADGAGEAALSPDGGFVAYASRAADLIQVDNNNDVDIFLRDRNILNSLRISVSSTGAESHPAVTHTTFPISYVGQPAVSRYGRFVAFASSAPDLVPNDTNNRVDIFVRDLVNGTT